MLRRSVNSYDGVFATRDGRTWRLDLAERANGSDVPVPVNQLFGGTQALEIQLRAVGLRVQKVVLEGSGCVIIITPGPRATIMQNAAKFARVLNQFYSRYRERPIQWRLYPVGG